MSTPSSPAPTWLPPTTAHGRATYDYRPFLRDLWLKKLDNKKLDRANSEASADAGLEPDFVKAREDTQQILKAALRSGHHPKGQEIGVPLWPVDHLVLTKDGRNIRMYARIASLASHPDVFAEHRPEDACKECKKGRYRCIVDRYPNSRIKSCRTCKKGCSFSYAKDPPKGTTETPKDTTNDTPTEGSKRARSKTPENDTASPTPKRPKPGEDTPLDITEVIVQATQETQNTVPRTLNEVTASTSTEEGEGIVVDTSQPDSSPVIDDNALPIAEPSGMAIDPTTAEPSGMPIDPPITSGSGGNIDKNPHTIPPPASDVEQVIRTTETNGITPLLAGKSQPPEPPSASSPVVSHLPTSSPLSTSPTSRQQDSKVLQQMLYSWTFTSARGRIARHTAISQYDPNLKLEGAEGKQQYTWADEMLEHFSDLPPELSSMITKIKEETASCWPVRS